MPKIATPENALACTSRRRAVKKILGGVTALAAYHALPVRWEKPIIETIFIPAHAQTSAVEGGDGSGGGNGNSETVCDRAIPNIFTDPTQNPITITVPACATSAAIELIDGAGGGGGGGGGGGSNSDTTPDTGGNGGEGAAGVALGAPVTVTVNPGETLTIYVGAGGIGGGGGVGCQTGGCSGAGGTGGGWR